MKLKYNNFMIIVPVFLLLGMVLALFNFSLEKRELMWGLDEELKSIATSTSIFIEHKNKSEEVLNNSYSDIETSFTKIVEYDRVKRMLLLQNREHILEVTAENLDTYKKRYQTNVVSKDNFFESEIYEDKELFLIDAFMKIKNSDLALVITLDATYVNEKLQEEYIEALVIVILVTLVGFIVSILLSIIVTKKLEELSLMAQALSSGKYNTEFKFGRVSEFSDLGATLDIMKSILQEVLFKTRNSIIQEELFSKESALVKLHSSSHHNQENLQSDNFSLSIKSLGENNTNIFYDSFEDETSIYAYFGVIASEQNPMKPTIAASSLSFYLNELLKRNTVNTLLLTQQYDIDSLVIAVVDKKSAQLHIEYVNKNNIESRDVDLNDGQTYILNTTSTTSPKLVHKIEEYRLKYPDLTLENITNDIALLCDEEDTFMLITKRI
jgi:methyl-accepting chemotaxis protein